MGDRGNSSREVEVVSGVVGERGNMSGEGMLFVSVHSMGSS